MHSAPLESSADGIENGRAWKWLWLSIALALAVTMLRFNWAHWGSVGLINDDAHREFVTPLRILRGERLYCDFNFVYGPLPPYVNAAILRASPVTPFTTLRIWAILLLTVQLTFLWLILRELAAKQFFGVVLAGTLIGVGTLLTEPSSFNGLMSISLSSGATYFAIRTLRRSPWAWLFTGACLSAALLSKPEGAFMAALALAGALASTQRRHELVRGILLSLLGGALVAIPFATYLLGQGLSPKGLFEGLMQRRFQSNLSAGYSLQLGYFFGINHAVVLMTGCTAILICNAIVRLYLDGKRLAFSLLAGILALSATLLALTGKLPGIVNDYQYLGDFFGGLLGWWWLRRLPTGPARHAFVIFWLSSLGGWLRPFLHIGAIVVPFRTGGGMLLAVLFWCRILPDIFKALHPAYAHRRQQIADAFLILGSLGALAFIFAGGFVQWDTIWRHPRSCHHAPYGDFCANADSPSTLRSEEAVQWLRAHLKSGHRFVALEGLPLELISGELPALPLSQLNYQLYPGDHERIISILETRKDISFVLVRIRNGGYHFGPNDYKLADYLDSRWTQVARFGVPDALGRLALMSPERKRDAGLLEGFIIYGRAHA